MKTYLVGGACRDTLMGLNPKDFDYVVVGSTPEQMEKKGFTQVGAFPVFLHPDTKEEYALARIEQKVGIGYNAFDSRWKGVTLEEDLSRRDLTINSIAWGNGIEIIDPFNGQQDIKDKILRHTSEAFVEDPVRVLRIARFLARFGEDWTVAPETLRLCIRVAREEFQHLTAERVFKEMDKALGEKYPWRFFEFLQGLDSHWFNELWNLQDIPQPIAHHPENWTFDHIMLCLRQGVKVDASKDEMFAILCHDFGKAPCYNERGNLHGHEEAGIPYVNALCDRLKVPASYRELAVKVCENHQRSHRALDMRPKSVHNLFKKLDCIRKPNILESFVLCNWADSTGRLGLEGREYPQAEYLHSCLLAVRQVDTKAISKESLEKGLTGLRIGENIRVSEIHAIREVKNKWKRN